MKVLKILAIAGLVSAAGAAAAAPPLGTKEEARRLAEKLVEIIDAEGVDAATKALYDPAQPFMSTRMGVNLFRGSVVIGDNREPETVAAAYDETEDLTGEPVWPRISAAADKADDAVLKWYHYDTQEVYDFKCFSMRASRDDGLVMICR